MSRRRQMLRTEHEGPRWQSAVALAFLSKRSRQRRLVFVVVDNVMVPASRPRNDPGAWQSPARPEGSGAAGSTMNAADRPKVVLGISPPRCSLEVTRQEPARVGPDGWPGALLETLVPPSHECVRGRMSWSASGLGCWDSRSWAARLRPERRRKRCSDAMTSDAMNKRYRRQHGDNN
jgi:hypothetical protein